MMQCLDEFLDLCIKMGEQYKKYKVEIENWNKERSKLRIEILLDLKKRERVMDGKLKEIDLRLKKLEREKKSEANLICYKCAKDLIKVDSCQSSRSSSESSSCLANNEVKRLKKR